MTNQICDYLSISLDTLIATAPLMGANLKDKRGFQQQQDLSMVKQLDACSSPIVDQSREKYFCFGSIDFLVTHTNDGERQFYPIEFNGTGTTGLVNLPLDILNRVLAQMSTIPSTCSHGASSLILLPYYDKKASNPLIYEKILIAEALLKGCRDTFGAGQIALLADPNLPELLNKNEPLILLGDIRQFIQQVELTDIAPSQNSLTLYNRAVSASFHDIFCQNLWDKFNAQINFQHFLPINALFPLCSDKSKAYYAMNEYFSAFPNQYFPKNIVFEVAQSEEVLIEKIMKLLQEGRQLVIKPHGAGIGNGIQFFVSNETLFTVQQKVSASITQTEQFYGVPGGAFPYTICEFMQAETIQQPDHACFQHKYELRFIVYQYNHQLFAAPSALKIAGQAYDPTQVNDLMLLMNATSIADSGNSSTVLPLCNQAALAATGLTENDFSVLSQFCTQFTATVLNSFSVE